MAVKPKAADTSPILNKPYETAERHYATDVGGKAPWHFIEIDDIERIRNQLTGKIWQIARDIDDAEERRFWFAVQSLSVDTVWAECDDKLFEPLT